MQRNAQATNILMGYLCSHLDMALYNEFGSIKDAHVHRKTLEAKFLKKTSIQDDFEVAGLAGEVRPPLKGGQTALTRQTAPQSKKNQRH